MKNFFALAFIAVMIAPLSANAGTLKCADGTTLTSFAKGASINGVRLNRYRNIFADDNGYTYAVVGVQDGSYEIVIGTKALQPDLKVIDRCYFE